MSRAREIDALITRLAARTCSVVHARDLRAAGVGRGEVLSRIRSGWMAPMLARTYGVGPSCTDPTFEMRCMAGVLNGGTHAAVDGEPGATLLGLWDRGDSKTVEVLLPGTSRRHAPPGYVFHRAPAGCCPEKRLHCGPIPVVGFIDLVCRMARSHTKWQIASIIQNGIHQRLMSLADLVAATECLRGIPGIGTLRDAMALVAAHSRGTRSRSEDVLLDALLRAGLPEPIVNTRGALGLTRDEPDFYWRTRYLNVEVDGDHHLEEPQRSDDLLRDADAEARGVRVIRVPWRLVWSARSKVVRAICVAFEGGVVEVDASRRIVV